MGLQAAIYAREIPRQQLECSAFFSISVENDDGSPVGRVKSIMVVLKANLQFPAVFGLEEFVGVSLLHLLYAFCGEI